MEKRVKEAVTVLAKSYGSVTAAASLWNLSPADVQQALLEVAPESVEHYILTLLAESNPIINAPKVKAEVIADSAT